jgi:hypothetical protein
MWTELGKHDALGSGYSSDSFETIAVFVVSRPTRPPCRRRQNDGDGANAALCLPVLWDPLHNEFDWAADIDGGNALSYLATICDELASCKDKFKELRDYFLKLDLFRFDGESISKELSSLYFEVVDDLKAWNCRQLRFD